MIFNHTYNGKVVARTFIEWNNNIALLHNNVFNFSKDIYYTLLDDFQEIKRIVKSKGYTKIIVTNKDADNKFLKYLKMFGFFEIKRGTVLGNEVTYSLMEL